MMKTFRSLLESLPSKTVVMVFGRMQPITSGHELLVKAVQKIASENKADHIVFLSKTQDPKKNPLQVKRKLYWAKRFFPSVNFVPAGDQTKSFIEAAKSLSGKYSNLIVIAGSDRVPEYKKLLDKYQGKEYNFDKIQVISAGERDPDSDEASGMSASKMRAAASKGDVSSFYKGLPSKATMADAKRLMNEIRVGMNLPNVKESVSFSVDPIRERYYNFGSFKVGSAVRFKDSLMEVIDRGSNYVVVIDEEGNIQKAWLKDIVEVDQQLDNNLKVVENQIHYKGRKTVNFDANKEAFDYFVSLIEGESSLDVYALVNALSNVDDVLSIEKTPISEARIDLLKESYNKAVSYLDKLNETPRFIKKYQILESLSDSLKVAQTIANILDSKVKSSNPEELVNSGLKSFSKITKTKDDLATLRELLKLADKYKINYDKKLLPKTIQESEDHMITYSDLIKVLEEDHPLTLEPSEEEKAKRALARNYFLKHRKFHYRIHEEASDIDVTEDELEELASELNEDELLELYDDEELGVFDEETGELIEDYGQDPEQIVEVLSRLERMKSKVRFGRTKSKRNRKLKIALKKRSSSQTINKRARRAAIKALKQRVFRNRDLKSLSTAEKERVEKRIERMKPLINKLATKFIPKIRNLERNRLS